MKEKNAFFIVLQKLGMLIVAIVVVAWIAINIYNPWAKPQDCDYEKYGCQGEDNKFGQ